MFSRASVTASIQLLRLLSFVLLMRALSNEDFEYFFSWQSLYSVIVLCVSGLPLFAKNLYLKEKIPFEAMRDLIICSSFLIFGVGCIVLFLSKPEFIHYVLVAFLLFYFRVVSGYVEYLFNVIHKYKVSLIFSLLVELVFLVSVYFLEHWRSLFGYVTLLNYSVVIGGLLVFLSLYKLFALHKRHSAFYRKKKQLLQFTSIEISSVIAFGLDLYFASLFMDSQKFVFYAAALRLFSPVTQFQGVVTRYLWSAGYNAKVEFSDIKKVSLYWGGISILFLLFMMLVSGPLFRFFDIDFQYGDEWVMLVFLLLIYSLIVLNRHLKNMANSKGITSNIWREYLFSTICLAFLVAMLAIFDINDSAEIYLIARIIFFGVVSFFVYRLIKIKR